MGPVTTKTTDSKGRLGLGKAFADKLVIVKQLAEGVVQITRAQAVPEAEAWLYKDRAAFEMVMRGIEDAKSGRLSAGPDLAAGDAPAESVGD